jgi:cell pole-organizing protein PopZ
MPAPGTLHPPAPEAQQGAPVETVVRAIVSADTGRQVHAAFGELNQAFQRSRSMSLEQVAEEMVRPMLQDWLDNNLPTLVERLVREEIERVARGS